MQNYLGVIYYFLVLLVSDNYQQPDDVREEDFGNIFNFYGDVYGDINGFAIGGDCPDSDEEPVTPESVKSVDFVTYNARLIPGFDDSSVLRLDAVTAAIVNLGQEADVMCL